MIWILGLALATLGILMLGYPVALTLAGVAAVFAMLGIVAGSFDAALLQSLPGRLFAVFTNPYFLAIPPFVLMGVTIEKTGLARALVLSMAAKMGGQRSGIAMAVVLAGALLAAVTGIVGASVIALALIAAKPMLDEGLRPSTVAGTVCAAGTLGQLVPPSILLVILADVMQNANASAQLELGNFAPDPVTAVDLFAGAILPAALLILLYLLWLGFSLRGERKVAGGPVSSQSRGPVIALGALAVLVLGSIFTGLASIVEAAAIGALGAFAIRHIEAWRLRLEIATEALILSASIFAILAGATIWSLVFRGFGGDALIHAMLSQVPGGLHGAVLIVMLVIFVAGFFLELIEILLIIVPLTAPALITLGADPLWLAILIGINLQTSFLTPPMGVSLFYFQGVAPPAIRTSDIYRGVMPFVALQLCVLAIVFLLPGIATSLPGLIF